MIDYKKSISLKNLLEAGCHFGHITVRFNPKIKPYIYTIKNKVAIFDLVQTRQKLLEAMEFLHQTAESGGEIIFVGTKRQAAEIVKEEAVKANVFYVNTRWWGGTLTNWKQIKQRIDLLVDNQKKLDEGAFDHYTKLEKLKIERKLQRLKRFLSGLIGFSGRPAAMVVMDVKKETTAIKEARYLNIPVVAIVDSNVDPESIEYPIPANDDAIASIKLILSSLTKAIKQGQAEFTKKTTKAPVKAGQDQTKAKPAPESKVAKPPKSKAQKTAKAKIKKATPKKPVASKAKTEKKAVKKAKGNKKVQAKKEAK